MEYVASPAKVEPGHLAKRSWRGRTIERHRAQIREAFGTRAATEDDEERLAQWLAVKVCPIDTNRDRLAEAVRERCSGWTWRPGSTSLRPERVPRRGVLALEGHAGQRGDGSRLHGSRHVREGAVSASTVRLIRL
ncbi:DUF4158 domain-containing protein [Nonomuraea fuscirosea]|uniref:DUF4158 domain-containing protein n=1 Tax=Nonomuraea fuscirosea TaxID=1291556 RepID=UPI003429D51D